MQLLEHFKELSLHPKNAKELKGLILSLALKGKLTENFRKIKTTYRENNTEGYYQLPDSWYWDKFDNICSFQMGKTPPSKEMEYWEGSHPWISIADMETYKEIFSTKKTVSDLGLKNYFKNTKVKKGTLIMSFKLSIGKTSILGIDACHNEAIISIYPNEKVTKEYLFLFLPIISNWGTQVNALMGNTLNKRKIQNLKVPLPCIDEQKQIVKTVNQLFKEVEQLELLTEQRVQLKEHFATSALKKLTEDDTQAAWSYLKPHFKTFFNEETNIKQLRESILRLAVQGKLTAKWRAKNHEFISGENSAHNLLQKIKAEKAQLIKDKKIKKEKPLPAITEDEIPFDVPEGWVWCRFDDVSLKIGDVDHKMPTEIETGYPYISPRDFGKRNSINFDNAKKISKEDFRILSKKIQPKRGDIIFPRYGTIGVNRIVETDIEFLASYSCAVVKHLDKFMNSYFVYYYSISPLVSAEIERYINKTTQPNVGIKSIKSFLFPLSSIFEQYKIVKIINDLMLYCDKLDQEITKSEQLKEHWMGAVLREEV